MELRHRPARPARPDGKRGLNAAAAAAIWVNRGGRRFVDESLSDKQRLPALLAQEGATYWAIFDQAAKRAFTVYGSDWGDFATVERVIFSDASLVRSAPTPEALAERIGLPGGPRPGWP